MNASKKTDGHGNAKKRAVYICAREQHLSRSRQLVDEPVLAFVREWLGRNAKTIARGAQPDAGPAQAKAADEVTELYNRLLALSELVASGSLDPTDYANATTSIRTKLLDAQRRSVASAGKPATALLLASDNIGAAFDELATADNREPLRQVLREVLDKVIAYLGIGRDGWTLGGQEGPRGTTNLSGLQTKPRPADLALIHPNTCPEVRLAGSPVCAHWAAPITPMWLRRSPPQGREPDQNIGATWGGGSTPRRLRLACLIARSAWRGSGRITTGQEAW